MKIWVHIFLWIVSANIFCADQDTSGWSIKQFTQAQERLWAKYVSFYVMHGAVVRVYRRYLYYLNENSTLTSIEKDFIQNKYKYFISEYRDIIERDAKYHADLDDLAWGKFQAYDRRHRL